jgi:hypothetical protein
VHNRQSTQRTLRVPWIFLSRMIVSLIMREDEAMSLHNIFRDRFERYELT